MTLHYSKAFLTFFLPLLEQDECSVKHLCSSPMLCQNNTNIYKMGQFSGKCALDLDIANVKFSWLTDRVTKQSICIAFSSKGFHKHLTSFMCRKSFIAKETVLSSEGELSPAELSYDTLVRTANATCLFCENINSNTLNENNNSRLNKIINKFHLTGVLQCDFFCCCIWPFILCWNTYSF